MKSIHTFSTVAVFLLVLMTSIAGENTVSADEIPASVTTARSLTESSLNACRPRFSPDGTRLVFHAGPPGARDIYVIQVDGNGLTRLTGDAADDRDATWNSTGDRIIWSSNREGTYDLYSMQVDGSSPERLTQMEGDEIEPAVSPLSYQMYLVGVDGCAEDGTYATAVDAYSKVVFTRQVEGHSEIWFHSFNGHHQGRLTGQASSCHSPSWSGDGLRLAWVCDLEDGPVVFHSQAQWDQSFQAALVALAAMREVELWELEGEGCEIWSSWDEVVADPCTAALPRRYSSFSGQSVSEPGAELTGPSYSANQILMLAARGENPPTLQFRPITDDGIWQTLDLDASAPHSAVWSPDGSRIAFDAERDGSRSICVAETDFYLQDVVDLVDYPELYGRGESWRLHSNHFVARAGSQREFFTLYDQLGYQRRAPFITTDAALQTVHDEFSTLLRQAEADAARELIDLTEALFNHYSSRMTDSDDAHARYYTEYFGVPLVLLRLFEQTRPTGDDFVIDELEPIVGPIEALEILEAFKADELDLESLSEYLSDWEIETIQRVLSQSTLSLEEQFRTGLPAMVGIIPIPVRANVLSSVLAIIAHDGTGQWNVPGRDQPVDVDWTQFIARGHYADSDLTGYFLAMTWYGQIPLPLDESLFDLLGVMERERTIWESWNQIDHLVGAFMGRPVDVTLRHLRRLRSEHPELLQPTFQDEAVLGHLFDLRGPVPFRGLSGAMAQLEGRDSAGQYPLQCTLFPRRYGLDVEFFSRLTHTDVPMKPFPAALEVFAGLGVQHAIQYAFSLAEAEPYFQTYREALDRLIEEDSERPDSYWSTDIYHCWLALLQSLATPPNLAEDSPLDFALTSAWQDRLLLSALAGYAQLKHDAVLYSFQEYGIECGADLSALILSERPVLPIPRGYVDPHPEFFESLARVAGRIYQELAGGEAPEVTSDLWSSAYHTTLEETLSGQRFAARLAAIARAEIAGEPLTDEDNRWLLLAGAMMERMFLNVEYVGEGAYGGDEGRLERGVALVTDVYTNIMRQQVLQLGVGRILDLYVALPAEIGRHMAQGGLFSFYEFTHPMADRLTDDAWNNLLESGQVPPLPTWTESFVESAP